MREEVFIGIMIILMTIIGILMGHSIGYRNGAEVVMEKAVEVGAASYNPTTKEFEWVQE